ncbi:MAG: sulfite exporter TauE/SafE family protein [Bacteroidales bacterium]|nr:sulfite exporter TauE/SafE family protein [Bacteroidales bacterium]
MKLYIILIISGLIVGFINTLAGGATIISISVFNWLGLPLTIANGTNRVAIIMQTLSSNAVFFKNKVIPYKNIWRQALAIVIGSLIGAVFAVNVKEDFFRYALMVVIVIMIVSMFINPKSWTVGKENNANFKRNEWLTIIVFFIIGLYGGFIHVGVGYYILFAGIYLMGYDVIKASAFKNFLVFFYVSISFIIFIINGLVNWEYGLVHGIGNIIGALIAARISLTKSINFVKWLIVAIMILIFIDLTGIISLKQLVLGSLGNV